MCPCVPLLILVAGAAVAASLDPARVDTVVESHVAALNEQGRANREEVEAVQTLVADLNGDGKAEIVLLSTRYFGNASSSQLTVFTDRGRGHVPVAQSSDALGQVEKIEVKDGRVLVHALWLGPRDARCCPSVKRTATYAWQGNKLVASKSGGSKPPPPRSN